MNIVVIIQARMGSSRLPGKVLKSINGKTLLEYLIERVDNSYFVNEIVVATTTNRKDDLIENFCKSNNLRFFRGSEDDVLSRYYHAALLHDASDIIRLCSDSPLIDCNLIDQMIEEYIDKKKSCDYYSNTIEQTYPLGMNIEIFSIEALKSAYLHGKKNYEREHVTPYIYTNPNIFKLCQKRADHDFSKIRLTVDEEEDFQVIKKIINILYTDNKYFGLEDVISLYESNMEIFKLNSHIKQKKIKPE